MVLHFLIIILIFITALTNATPSQNVSGDFCSALVLVNGYPCEQYKVKTEDGYILNIYRISHGISASSLSTTQKQPVFLQHGVLAGGDIWVYDPPENSLGFVLADEGFDVWIGNLRGTHWSREHTSYTTTDKAYWDWTWDEHAQYDLPAMLNKVHEITGSKVYYVGHSQGTAIAIASFSESQSKVLDVVKAAVLLSPIAYLKSMTSILSRLAALLYFDQIYVNLGNTYFALDSGIGSALLKKICMLDSQCADLLVLVTGKNCCFNNSLTTYYRQFEPQGSSTKNMVHLAQMVRSGLFAKFDYGSTASNVKAYSQVVPPTYDPSDIPYEFPMLLMYGGKDALSTPQGVRLLASQLNCRYQSVYLPNYAHVDFIIGTRAKTEVFDPLIKFIRDNP